MDAIHSQNTNLLKTIYPKKERVMKSFKNSIILRRKELSEEEEIKKQMQYLLKE